MNSDSIAQWAPSSVLETRSCFEDTDVTASASLAPITLFSGDKPNRCQPAPVKVRLEQFNLDKPLLLSRKGYCVSLAFYSCACLHTHVLCCHMKCIS